MGEKFAGRKTGAMTTDGFETKYRRKLRLAFKAFKHSDAIFSVVQRATFETHEGVKYLCVDLNGNWFSFAGPNVNRVHDDFYVWAVSVLSLGKVDQILTEEREFLAMLDSHLANTRAIRAHSPDCGKKGRVRKRVVESGYVSYWDQVD